ncbi:MAG: hypothetical protein ABFD66_15825, partial [Smithella sp.]
MDEKNHKDECHYKLLEEEMKTLHALETWGCSLFLAAIALVGKSLIDWNQASSSNNALKDILHWQMDCTPAVRQKGLEQSA